ncbi:MAG: response regulator [Gammaproteobacteria bacterium]|nr:response regulator [Gammaproteobacteria bacterium]
MSIKVTLADDHENLRTGFRGLLESADEIEVISEAGNGRETVEQVAELKPDVVVMDVAMPGINGVDATREITEIAPNVRVLALSGHNDGFFVKGMLEAGARGYLLKDAAVNELVTAVRTLSEGRIYVSPSVIDTLTYSFLSTVSELNASRQKQKQLLDEIQVKNSELERQNAELERFTYSVSHDLRAPLVTIKGFIGLLQKDITSGKSETIQSDLKQISDATDNMATQLDELLELSRVGRLVNPPVEIDLNEMAASVVALFSSSITESDVDIKIDQAMPVAYGDAGRIFEVFQNLVGNAIKFANSEDTSVVEIGAEESAGQVVCHVRDNGVGIQPEYLERIFNLFERLDPQVEGTGIGLALAKRIVEFHNGKIWAESKGLGRGSTFWFSLPVNQ